MDKQVNILTLLLRLQFTVDTIHARLNIVMCEHSTEALKKKEH